MHILSCIYGISNDKKFMSRDIELLTSDEFVRKYLTQI